MNIQTSDKRSVLIVEDDDNQRRLMARILQAEGYLVGTSASAEDALTALRKQPLDLVVSDWKLPGADGLELLEIVQREFSKTAFIIATAYGSISHAVSAVRRGADDYLVKPFQRQTLLLSVEKALRARSLLEENRLLSEALQERDRLVEMIGRARAMRHVFRRLEKVAPTRATVLVSGASGTGKELAARAIHSLSERNQKPFIVLDCAAIPEGLLESELFGAEKGAYTGAEERRIGKFEAAHKGTLFLDEVGELPLKLQPKLLRVVQSGRFTRVGGTQEIEVDVRLVSATNRDLAKEVQAGDFRQDLYYRLNVVPVAMPALRERREDIPLLIEHFMASSCRRHGVPLPRLTSPVLKRLVDYPWPGNVRQLGNVIERLVLLAENGEVRVEDLPNELERDISVADFKLPAHGISWEEHERQCLSQALELAAGNKTRAAQLLDLPYKAFLYRLEKHGLP